MKNILLLLIAMIGMSGIYACKSTKPVNNDNLTTMKDKEPIQRQPVTGIFLEDFTNAKEVTDYTTALRAAIEMAHKTKLPILLVPNKVYPIKGVVNVSNKNFEIRNNGILKGEFTGYLYSNPKDKNSEKLKKLYNNLFILNANATSNIILKEVQFADFENILDLGKRDVTFSMVAEGIQVDNAASLVYSVNQQMSDKITMQGCTRFVLRNSTMTNMTGSVVRITQRNVNNITIESNLIDGVKLYYKQRIGVLEVGNGNYNSNSHNINIQGNTVQNCEWIGGNTAVPDQNCDKAVICAAKVTVSKGAGGAAILALGCQQVNITNNILYNLYSRHKCDPTSRKATGIYVKSRDCIIANNNLLNAGDGEGTIITKGWANTETAEIAPGSALSYNNIINNNHIAYEKDYHKRITTYICGITAYNKNIMISNNQIIGTSTGVEIRGLAGNLTANAVGNINIFNNQIIDLQKLGVCRNKVIGIVLDLHSNRINIENNIIQYLQNDPNVGNVDVRGIYFNLESFPESKDYLSGIVINGNVFRYLHKDQAQSSIGIDFASRLNAKNLTITSNTFEQAGICMYFDNRNLPKGEELKYSNLFITGNNAIAANTYIARQKNTTISDCMINNNKGNNATEWLMSCDKIPVLR